MKIDVNTPSSGTEAVKKINILMLEKSDIAIELRKIMDQEIDFYFEGVPGITDTTLRERNVTIESENDGSAITTTIGQWLWYRYVEEKDHQEDIQQQDEYSFGQGPSDEKQVPTPVAENFPSSASIPTVINEGPDDESIHATYTD